MISIRKASDDLARLDEVFKAARESYVHAVMSAAQYAVELDSAESGEFREHLERIRQDAERAACPSDWPPIQASFRGELRRYHDLLAAQVGKLRSEMKAAADAMEAFADNVATSGADHKKGLEDAVETLDTAIRAESLREVRAVLAGTKTQLCSSIERMEREHKLVIAQLRDEIRSLHQQIDADRRAQFLDQATGTWNRAKLDSLLQQMLENDEAFYVLVVRIRNLKRLEQRYPATMIEGGFKVLVQRMTAMLGSDAIMGRWEESAFAAILQIDPAAVLSLSREATARLAGSYSVQQSGLARAIELHAVSGVIERQRGTDAASFHKKLLQMTEALSNS